MVRIKIPRNISTKRLMEMINELKVVDIGFIKFNFGEEEKK